MQHLPNPYTPSWQFNHVPSPLATGRNASSPSLHYAVHYDSPRAAKRSRSKSSSREDMDLDPRRLRPILPHLRTSGTLESLPTPPLSASSSISSAGSSIGSSICSFPRSFSLQTWQPSSTGILYGSPSCAKGYANLCPEDLSNYARNGFATPALKADEVYDFTKNQKSLERSRQHSQPEILPSAYSRVASQLLQPQHSLPPAPELDAQQLQLEYPPAETAQDAKFVEGLVGTSMLAIESIWSTTPSTNPAASSSDKVLPLKYFIKETLRRSRSNAQTLQVALYYLHRARVPIRERVVFAEKAKKHFSILSAQRKAEAEKLLLETGLATPPGSPNSEEFTRAASEVLATSRDPVVCGRRMFLASLICASKFLQDRNYSNRAWSRLSGLPVSEINANERAFLDVLGYELFIKPDTFTSWCARLHKLALENEVKILRLTMSPPSRASLKRSNTDYDMAPTQIEASCNPVSSPTRLMSTQRSSLSRSVTEMDSLRRRSLSHSLSHANVSALQCSPIHMARRASDAVQYSSTLTSTRKLSTAFDSPASMASGRRPSMSRRLSSSLSGTQPSWPATIDVC